MKYKAGLIAGSFDLIHAGYIRMFKDAKNVCDKLIVALQGDPTIDRPFKCKPVQTLEERIEVMNSIRFIDEIVTYNTEAELLELLKNTRHDVRILGTDYIDKKYTGDGLGTPVHWHERNHNISTTSLKEAIYQERLLSKNK
jgi:glycerol-3-phosphate cytidylyltransferase